MTRAADRETAPQNVEMIEPLVFRKRIDEVMVFFSVRKGHKLIDDLDQNEINVTDDLKTPTRISSFGHQSDLPLRLGLLVDTSDSIEERFGFEKDSASEFGRQILKHDFDRAFVLGFAQHSTLVQDYTGEAGRLVQGLSRLHATGTTAVYDAVTRACRKLAEDAQDGAARIVVLLSDGADNASETTLDTAIQEAQRADVTIYAISTNSSGSETSGDRVLKRFATETGGYAFFPENPKETVKAFRAVEQEMRTRYVVSYRPRDFVPDGRFRTIKIIARRMQRQLNVHARRGYYAPLSSR